MKAKKMTRKMMIFSVSAWLAVAVILCLIVKFNPFTFLWFDVILPAYHFFAIVFSAMWSFSTAMYELFKPETFWGWVWFVILVVPIILTPLYVLMIVLFAGKLSHHDTVVPPSYLK